jgi:transposase
MLSSVRLPADRPIHVVLDNYATYKHPKVLAWLARHPRWTFHFTPTSASWLNAVETSFSKITRQRIRRGVFHSIADLQAAINAYLAAHNAAPNPSSGPNLPTPFWRNSTAALCHLNESVH